MKRKREKKLTILEKILEDLKKAVGLKEFCG
jgi:hypothetical protein